MVPAMAVLRLTTVADVAANFAGRCFVAVVGRKLAVVVGMLVANVGNVVDAVAAVDAVGGADEKDSETGLAIVAAAAVAVNGNYI